MALVEEPRSRRADDVESFFAHQDAARDAVSEFLGRPSRHALHELDEIVVAYLRDEDEWLLPTLRDRGIDPAEVAAQHERIVAAYKALLWETPGTFAGIEHATLLRHCLLRQLDLTRRLFTPDRRAGRIDRSERRGR